MRRMDEIIRQIREAELSSKTGESFLNEKPLSEEEASELLRAVKAKQAESLKPQKKKKLRRWGIILVAAVMLLFGLTAVGVNAWPVLFDNIPPSADEDLVYLEASRFGQFADLGWDRLDSEFAYNPNETLESNGVTVTVRKAVYGGVFLLAEIEITVPDNGASIDENCRDLGFEKFDWRFVSNIDCSFGSEWKDRDPQDNKLHLYIALNSKDLLVNNNISLWFENLAYLDGNGKKKVIEGKWNPKWKNDNSVNETSFEKSFEEALVISEEQLLTSIKLYSTYLVLEIDFTEKYNPKRDPLMFSPLIELYDGSVIDYDYPVAQNSMNIFRTGTTLYVMFSEPLDLDQVAEIQYGSLVIPVN